MGNKKEGEMDLRDLVNKSSGMGKQEGVIMDTNQTLNLGSCAEVPGTEGKRQRDSTFGGQGDRRGWACEIFIRRYFRGIRRHLG